MVGSPTMSSGPIPCAGVICLRGDAVLLVRRGRPPRAGEWSLPGGRIERGETAAECAARELLEETGVTSEIGPLIAVVEAVHDARRYLMIDYAARWTAGEPRAGDDAADARFFSLDEALAAVRWEETRRVIGLAAGGAAP